VPYLSSDQDFPGKSFPVLRQNLRHLKTPSWNITSHICFCLSLAPWAKLCFSKPRTYLLLICSMHWQPEHISHAVCPACHLPYTPSETAQTFYLHMLLRQEKAICCPKVQRTALSMHETRALPHSTVAVQLFRQHGVSVLGLQGKTAKRQSKQYSA